MKNIPHTTYSVYEHRESFEDKENRYLARQQREEKPKTRTNGEEVNGDEASGVTEDVKGKLRK